MLRAVVAVTLPETDGESEPKVVSVDVRRTEEGPIADFADTTRIGVYRWNLAGKTAPESGGQFVVNPVGEETDLSPIGAERFRQQLRKGGMVRVYVGRSLAEVSAAAVGDTQGRNWWDLLLAIVIVLLVVEAVIANRLRRGDEIVPAHLNPKLAA